MVKMQQNPREFLLQLDVIGELLPKIGREQWQTLYLNADEHPHRFGMWCALLDENAATRAVGHDSWDHSMGDGRPGFSQSWSEGKEVTTYERFGGGDGVRPLVLYRSFHGAFPKYLEIDEEFRLYHDLAEDKTNGILLDFDESGREIEVVRITQNEVCARLKYLRQFQAATRLYLAIYIDSVRYSQLPLESIPSGQREHVQIESGVRWRRNVAEGSFMEDYNTFSRVLAKVILPPPTLEEAGVWPFEDADDQRAVAFIIDVDETGNEVEYTSDPDKLSNYFGANPNSPHYLTPVYFRREVLVKYFAEPERYNVLDGRLICLSLWSCQIDNDLNSHVVVFLGDLGRDLPYAERLHWRQFNVPPEGGVSETNFRRSFLAEFADPQSPDLTFRHEYADIVREWEKRHGWSLFLIPSSGDEHLLQTIRIPVTNSQTEFDEQISQLSKLLVDSLNEKELAARSGSLQEGAKGIGKLDSFLEATEFPERQSVIQLLRDLQALRSSGSAHRKGAGYEKIIAKLGVDMKRKPAAVRKLLEETIVALQALRVYYCENRVDTGNDTVTE